MEKVDFIVVFLFLALLPVLVQLSSYCAEKSEMYK